MRIAVNLFRLFLTCQYPHDTSAAGFTGIFRECGVALSSHATLSRPDDAKVSVKMIDS
jgi:hypothetical protein